MATPERESTMYRLYLDASVIGGKFDAGFDKDTNALLDAIRAGEFSALISDTLVAEIADAPERVRETLASLEEGEVEHLPVTDEALLLRDAYLAAGVVTGKARNDALHVAQATVARADVIVSWNFKHLVNPVRIRQFNGVNVGKGYGMLVIMTPTDVIRLIKEADL